MSFLQSKYGMPTLTWLLAEAATPAIYQPATGGGQRIEPAAGRNVNFQVKLDNDDATVQLLYEVDVPTAPLVMRLMLMETFDLLFCGRLDAERFSRPWVSTSYLFAMT